MPSSPQHPPKHVDPLSQFPIPSKPPDQIGPVGTPTTVPMDVTVCHQPIITDSIPRVVLGPSAAPVAEEIEIIHDSTAVGDASVPCFVYPNPCKAPSPFPGFYDTNYILELPRGCGRQAERVIHRLRFPNSHRIEARGFAGGLWLLWDEEKTLVEVLFNHPQFLHVRVSKANSSFLFTAVYGSPQEGWRRFLWRNLEALAATIQEPWIVGGDFNAILSGAERRNRFGHPGQASSLFVDCCLKMNLLDLGFVGCRFTWCSGDKRTRLDRFFCNSEWRREFPEATVIHLPRVGSDHCPILLKYSAAPPPPSDRPFRGPGANTRHRRREHG
ncbi:hypothetical protein Tsubulata_051413 [Turnera subulata]|uniref:Endonuclease/exonuclease/phosphatase domain-containing protein n=1 Tax=Turnera subulata TaxID=218843 RepID=A0A9Q0FB74_9ROSI|nr:hypothetical protein Tsubulata_051413 [Turnera subulata]